MVFEPFITSLPTRVARSMDGRFTVWPDIGNAGAQRRGMKTYLLHMRMGLTASLDYSPISNIGDIWSLEEGSDESSIVLDIDEVGLDAVLQKFV